MNSTVLVEEPTQVSIRSLLRGLLDEVGLSRSECQPLLTSQSESRVPQSQGRPARGATPPSIAYLLPGLPPEGSGGSHSLVQEARGLRQLGASARVCVPHDSLETATAVYGNDDQLFVTYSEDPPASGAGSSSALDTVADADVAIATEYPSVDLLAQLALRRPHVLCAYYVQDYEPLFAAPESSRSDRALLSYRALPNLLLFAKTDWLRDLVGALHGVAVAKIAPSLDRELFHPGGRVEFEGMLRVAAMIRPRTPRRRPVATLHALAAIESALGERVEIVTFGCPHDSFAQLDVSVPGIQHLGLLSRLEVAELMRRCEVFIDASAYQAFGRTGLEAMACGAVPLLPGLGGVHEYARHDHNALILDDGSPAQIAAAVAQLAHDPARLRRLREAGLRTAVRFSIQRAARSQLDLFAAAVTEFAPVAEVAP